MPKYITMDFELGIRAINHEFPESRIIVCYFHFKQAINKKLPKFKISNQDLKIILEKIELLTLVSNQSMKWILQLILLSLLPQEPTIHSNDKKRRMNDHFLNARPNICMFVEVIRNQFEFYEQRCLEIRQNGSNIRYKNK
ncbi:hypothetical protein HZS_5077 [Henneguya salminicola]|nr:hypothetical protein HZS_5077 [Henneguya salminicola]